jgi:hypothetical protein
VHTTYTTVLERRSRITSDHHTLPYEAGWATEAVFFAQTEGVHPPLTLAIEVSPDGINWIRRGEPVTLGVEASITELTAASFGNWLRLSIDGAAPDTPARILVHLNLKG